MTCLIIVTGGTDKDRLCFSGVLSGYLEFYGTSSVTLQLKDLAQVYLNKNTEVLFGNDFIADGEWLNAFLKKTRETHEIDWADFAVNAMETYMILDKKVIILPDLWYMDDLTALLPSSYGFVRLDRETETGNDFSIATTRELDMTYKVGDCVDVFEAGMSYGKELLLSMNGGEDDWDDLEEFPVDKPNVETIDMYG